ncbi:MAG: type 1 glutamine amidotransferase, partial [Rhodospirillales bacterium]|nr:type 1 glutamine amidotransferase [Rhodospirillales bacterium]
MGIEPRFLVIDGYVKSSRDELAAGGATTAGFQYKGMLETYAPGCSVDILYP